MRVAVECFADLSLLQFLRDSCGFGSLADHHSYSQGQVIKAMFEGNFADAGIVDEDPGKPHHRLRDDARLLVRGIDVDLFELRGKRIYVVKPDLERCFMNAMKRVKEVSWFKNASHMHELLGTGARRPHDRFKGELDRLRNAEADKAFKGLISELVAYFKSSLK